LRGAEGAASARAGDEVEEVPDVDHALRVVEGLAVDGQARMAGGAEESRAGRPGWCRRNRHDVGPGHHHVLDPDAVEAEHVLEHRPFLGREVRVLDGLREGVLQVVPDRIAGFQAEAVEEALVPALPGPVRIGHVPGRRLVRLRSSFISLRFSRARTRPPVGWGRPHRSRRPPVTFADRADAKRVCPAPIASGARARGRTIRRRGLPPGDRARSGRFFACPRKSAPFRTGLAGTLAPSR
jgi:hypothetical protein